MIEFDVFNRFSNALQFTAEIDCDEHEHLSWKLRLAIFWGIGSKTNLCGADLSRANLSGANLSGVDLSGADLSRANLSWANLSGADLSWTNLSEANLSWANFSEVNLSEANLSGTDPLMTQPPRTVILPEGDLIVYKKLIEGVCKLKIPKESLRSNSTRRKCRAEYAEVLELPEKCNNRGTSRYDPKFTYTVGQTVRCHAWSKDWWKECAGGIHFFLTKEEAEQY